MAKTLKQGISARITVDPEYVKRYAKTKAPWLGLESADFAPRRCIEDAEFGRSTTIIARDRGRP